VIADAEAKTVGELVRMKDPTWQHECCYPSGCAYKHLDPGGVIRCWCGAKCDFLVPAAVEQEGVDAGAKDMPRLPEGDQADGELHSEPGGTVAPGVLEEEGDKGGSD